MERYLGGKVGSISLLSSIESFAVKLKHLRYVIFVTVICCINHHAASQDYYHLKKEVDSLNNLASGLYHTQIESVYAISKKALDNANEIEYEYGIIYAERNLGVYYAFALKKEDDAFKYFLKSHYNAKVHYNFNDALKDEFAHEVYYTALQLANICSSKELLPQQHHFLSIAETFLLRTDYDEQQLNLLKAHKGFSYNILKQHKKALQLFIPSLEFLENKPTSSRDRRDTLFILDLRNLIAKTYCEISDFNEASVYVNKNMNMIKQLENSNYLKSITFYVLGKILIGQKRYKEALALSAERLSISETIQDTLLAYQIRGSAYYKMNDLQNAKKFLEPLLRQSKINSRKPESIEVAKILKSIYKKENNAEKLTEMEQLINSLTSKNTNTESEILYYSKMLEKENRKVEKRIHFSEKGYNLLLILCSLLLVLILLWFRFGNEKNLSD
ncbi:MAG: hypothetical protein AAF348_14915 [Bacteroidota bacterium]